MNYTIDGVIERYPGINIGVLIGSKLKIGKSNLELEKYKSSSIEIAVKNVGSVPVGQVPHIASWREMYRSFGTKPGDYHSSIEALTRRVIKMGQLPLINTAVDVYNSVSLRYMIPMGGFDTDHVEGDIALRFSQGNEEFAGLGMIENEHTYLGEVVYSDARRILTRRWNFRDCIETMITEATSNLVMFIDGSPEIPRFDVEMALRELADQLEMYCGGSYASYIADKANPVIKIG